MSLLPLKDAAQAIDVPYRSVYHHAQKGRIPTQQIGRYQVIEPAVLAAVLAALGYQRRTEKEAKGL